MTARMRRLAADYEQVKKDFTGHKNIIVTPIGTEPPEKYHVTYFVNGIYLLPDGRVETLARHEVEITLHAEYPRYKPLCRIMTPIWHPNFRDGQICIGDIWGAGETLTDIIINIGNMIQYKSWNSSSPLSADAAKWALENKHLFPVGNIELTVSDYASATDEVEIDLFDENEAKPEETVDKQMDAKPVEQSAGVTAFVRPTGNDFDITPEELAGIEFVPTEQRMHTASHNGMVKSGSVNFKTILTKGLLWALIGSILSFAISEALDHATSNEVIADRLGYAYLSDYYRYTEMADEEFSIAYSDYLDYCERNDYDTDDDDAFADWYRGDISGEAKRHLDKYSDYDDEADDALYDAYQYEFNGSDSKFEAGLARVSRISSALWAAIIAMFIGLFLGIGEGVFYGSKEKALKYAAIGAGISLLIGFASGYLAQAMYSEMLSDEASEFAAALVRGAGWAVMGLGIGVSIGLIRPDGRRILYCAVGGLGGGFLGGFLFNYVTAVFKFGANDTGAAGRAAGITIMGLLIGLGIGLLEQFAKQAWLKVVRGEFEGKEYLVFAGTTSIGNNGKNSIVLFKDRLVGPHHCDIVLEGSKYVLVDCGTPMGTVVNGMRISKCILKKGDAIAVGNSVLVFNTK